MKIGDVGTNPQCTENPFLIVATTGDMMFLSRVVVVDSASKNLPPLHCYRSTVKAIK